MERLNCGENMKRTIAMFLGLILISSVLSTYAQNSEPSSPSTAASQVPSTYVIGPDDVLYISVWKEPDLTNTLPVRPDGMVSMPLLHDVQAAGLTPTQLSDSITEKLKKYITDPHVTVVVTQMNSQRIYVMGEVQHTGAMNLLPGMTVLQALAAAGFTQFANTKGIYILRDEHGTQKKIPVDYKKLVKGEDMNQNIVLKPRDTIVVP
jgi:polysaccharide biosynthesis/export protein